MSKEETDSPAMVSTTGCSWVLVKLNTGVFSSPMLKPRFLSAAISRNRPHLQQVLDSYRDYYNASRCHLALEKTRQNRERLNRAKRELRSSRFLRLGDCTTATHAKRRECSEDFLRYDHHRENCLPNSKKSDSNLSIKQNISSHITLVF